MATREIQVSFPQELAFALNMREHEFAQEVLRLSLVKLYELGKISSGKAAKMLGINRSKFLDLAGTYRVSILGNPTEQEILEDLSHA